MKALGFQFEMNSEHVADSATVADHFNGIGKSSHVNNHLSSIWMIFFSLDSELSKLLIKLVVLIYDKQLSSL